MWKTGSSGKGNHAFETSVSRETGRAGGKDEEMDFAFGPGFTAGGGAPFWRTDTEKRRRGRLVPDCFLNWVGDAGEITAMEMLVTGKRRNL